MTKREFQALLDESGLGLMACARELGLAQSTVSRWVYDVPRYAVAYAVLRAELAKTDQDALARALKRAGTPKGEAG